MTAPVIDKNSLTWRTISEKMATDERDLIESIFSPHCEESKADFLRGQRYYIKQLRLLEFSND